jgi:hypothetical protein
LPLNWNLPETRAVVPVTFFSMKVPFPQATRAIEIWNRGTGKKLAVRTVSENQPQVQLSEPPPVPPSEQGPLQFSWQATDKDGDALTYTVLVSPDGRTWWPAAHGLRTDRHQLERSVLEPARYFIKVIASDGVNTGESNTVQFNAGTAQ